MPKKLKHKLNWPALSTVDFNVVPDSTFNIGSGITTITPNLVSLLWGMPPDSYEANRILYPEKTVVNPYIGQNTIIYNPKTNNRDAVALDALHVMHDSPLYLELYQQYVQSLPKGFEPLMDAANDEFGERGMTIIDKYQKGLPLSQEELEAIEPIYDALLRRQFAPDYMRNVPHGYQDKATLPVIESIGMSGDEAIRRYIESYPLKEVTVTANKKADGGELNTPLEWDLLSMKEKAAYIRMGVASGYKDIDSIKGVYNQFKKGGPTRKLVFLNTLEQSLANNSRYNTPGWRKYLTDLANMESGYQAGITNSIGAKGYFQLMPFNRAASWSTPTQQFDEMYRMTDANMLYLRKHMTEKDLRRANELGIDIYGLMAGAHLGGAKGALNALRGTRNAKDKNGTSVMSYMTRFSQTTPRVTGIEGGMIPIIDNTYLASPEDVTIDNTTVIDPNATLEEIRGNIPQAITIEEEEPVGTVNLDEVVVTGHRKPNLVAMLDFIDAVSNSTTPMQPIYQLQEPASTKNVMQLVNNDRVTLLQKDLEDRLLADERRRRLGYDYRGNVAKDIDDIRFYRNMAAYGGKVNKFEIGGPTDPPVHPVLPSNATMELAQAYDKAMEEYRRAYQAWKANGGNQKPYTKTYVDSQGRTQTFHRSPKETDEQYEARYNQRMSSTQARAATNQARYLRRQAANAEGAARFNRAANLVTDAMQQSVDSGQQLVLDLHDAAEIQRQLKILNFHDTADELALGAKAALTGIGIMGGFGTIGSQLGTGLLGGEGVDLTTQVTTPYKNWANMISQTTGLNEGIAELTNPGYFVPWNRVGNMVEDVSNYTYKNVYAPWRITKAMGEIKVPKGFNTSVSLMGHNYLYPISTSTKLARVIAEDTYPLYMGPKHSITEVVNLDGTINPRAAMRIQHEVADNIPGAYRMENRLENPIWHVNDPTTFYHTKNVAQSAYSIPTPEGLTKQDLMIAALGHDFGKIISGDGHAKTGAALAEQVFPDITNTQLTAIREHMGTPSTPLGIVTKLADIMNGKLWQLPRMNETPNTLVANAQDINISPEELYKALQEQEGYYFMGHGTGRTNVDPEVIFNNGLRIKNGEIGNTTSPLSESNLVTWPHANSKEVIILPARAENTMFDSAYGRIPSDWYDANTFQWIDDPGFEGSGLFAVQKPNASFAETVVNGVPGVYTKPSAILGSYNTDTHVLRLNPNSQYKFQFGETSATPQTTAENAASEMPNIVRTVLNDGKIRLSLPSHTDSKPRQFVLEPAPTGDNKYYVHMRMWDDIENKVPASNVTNEEKQQLFDALYDELPEGAEILFPKSGPGNYGTRGTVVGLQRLSRDPRFTPGTKGTLQYLDKDGKTVRTYEGTSFIKTPRITE